MADAPPRHRLRRVALALGALVVAAVLALGARYAATLPLRAVEVRGATFADAATLRALAAVPDSARLLALEPELLADRLRRDPWVRHARVHRRLDGTLVLRVTERTPAALALGPDGRPAYFLDAEGYALPATPEALAAGFDVPLLLGAVPPFHPTRPVEDPALVATLAALAAAGPATDALVSAVERAPSGALTLVTVAAPSGRPLRVALGPHDVPEQLRRLQAFWEQAVLPRPDRAIRRVDLRFRGQIVTEEA